MTPEAARAKLETLSIQVSDESFFNYLKAGDREVVEIFLDAGISPDLVDAKRTAAIVIAMEAGQKDLARLLLARGGSPDPLLIRTASKKDGWDKMTASSAVLNFISSLLIALVGGSFTYLYNQRQTQLNTIQTAHDADTKDQANKIVELEAVQKMIPFVTSNDEHEKKAALIAIHDLAHPNLASHFALAFEGPGSVQFLEQAASSGTPGNRRTAVQALSTIVASGTEADSKLATSALSNVFDSTGNSVVKITISIEIPETVDRAEADRAAQELRSHGYEVKEINVKRVGESTHETTVRFFQYDRKTVAIGKELVQLLKGIGFTVRTEFDDEFVGNPSPPFPPGTFQFWIGLNPSYNPSH